MITSYPSKKYENFLLLFKAHIMVGFTFLGLGAFKNGPQDRVVFFSSHRAEPPLAVLFCFFRRLVAVRELFFIGSPQKGSSCLCTLAVATREQAMLCPDQRTLLSRFIGFTVVRAYSLGFRVYGV